MKASEQIAVLRAAGMAPKKSFGQNFLVSDAVLARIAAASVPDSEIGTARVVELGAGLGALTSVLVARAAHVTAVERDRDLIPLLERSLAESVLAERLTILEADAQTLDLAALFANAAGAPRVLAGNLPYQITGQLLRLAIEHATILDRVVFMMQSEVAARVVSAAGSKEYGALSVFVQAAFSARILEEVPAGAFVPPPRVTSAVVALVPLKLPRARVKETPIFRALVKAAFGARRKTLRNAWRAVTQDAQDLERAATTAGVSLDARGETLDVDAYDRVARALAPKEE